MALLAKREAEEKARDLKNKRVAEENPVVISPAKKAKVVEAPVRATVPSVAAAVPVPVPVDAAVVTAPVEAAFIPVVVAQSVAVPAAAPFSNVVTMTEDLPEFEEDNSEFPSLSKPVVLSGRRGSGRLSDPSPGAAASTHTPVLAVGAVVQESQSIVQEIDEMKRRLDENKRRYSLE